MLQWLSREKLTFFPKSEKEGVQKKGTKKPNDGFFVCRAKISPKKRKSPEKERFEHKAARIIIQSTCARARRGWGVSGMRER